MTEMTDFSDRLKYAKRLGLLGLGCIMIQPAWPMFCIFIWAVMIYEIGINYAEYVAKSRTFFVQTAMTLLMMLIVTLGVVNMIRLRYVGWEGFALLVVNMLTVIASDSLQYFVGKKMGRHKFSRFSPNKTWEGFVGGAGLSAIIGVVLLLLASLLVNFGENFDWQLVLVAVIPLVGTIGDLYESALKRALRIKDFSNYLGSHGGFTDRFDANVLVHATLAFAQLQLLV